MIKLALILLALMLGTLVSVVMPTFPERFDLATRQQETAAPMPNEDGSVHANIITTVFWVGEGANTSNSYISNRQSAWDTDWQSNFGGVDSPKNRNGYYPGAFTPQENPFYVALPYNDFNENGQRKNNAANCKNSNEVNLGSYSWCKNTWVQVRSSNGAIAYAQWEDVGPYEEDDADYVFGGTNPSNTQGSSAGLDVSPAVAQYLKLPDVSKTSWKFVDAKDVPSGPWKEIVTSSKGSSY